MEFIKKYLIFIGNRVYRDINKNDLLDIENGTLRYIPYEEVIMGVNVFENYLDKAIVLLLRNGLKGEEIINIKMDDINVEKNEIKLEDKKIILDDYTMGIIDKASKERGYKMYVKEKVIMITTTIMKIIHIYGKIEKINLTMMD